MTLNDIDQGIIEKSKRWSRLVPGDWPSIACAQWALETGWGLAESIGGRVWREGFNGGGVKRAQKDARFQAGEIEGYARYTSIDQYLQDRARIIASYQRSARDRGEIPWDVLDLLDRWWAPEQGYREKLIQLIRDHRLYQLDPRANI